MKNTTFEAVVDLGEKIIDTARKGCGGDGHLCLQGLLTATGTHLDSMPPQLREQMPESLREFEKALKTITGMLVRASIELKSERN